MQRTEIDANDGHEDLKTSGEGIGRVDGKKHDERVCQGVEEIEESIAWLCPLL